MPRTSVKDKKSIMLITEGQTDASIIRSLIDAHDRKVYMVATGGYQNIASMIRTQYLIHGDGFYYIAVFDSDNSDNSVRIRKLEMVRFLSKADLHQEIIGVFCFRNTIEKELGLPRICRANNESLIDALKKGAGQMKQQSDTIKEIQKFIDSFKS